MPSHINTLKVFGSCQIWHLSCWNVSMDFRESCFLVLPIDCAGVPACSSWRVFYLHYYFDSIPTRFEEAKILNLFCGNRRLFNFCSCLNNEKLHQSKTKWKVSNYCRYKSWPTCCWLIQLNGHQFRTVSMVNKKLMQVKDVQCPMRIQLNFWLCSLIKQKCYLCATFWSTQKVTKLATAFSIERIVSSDAAGM